MMPILPFPRSGHRLPGKASPTGWLGRTESRSSARGGNASPERSGPRYCESAALSARDALVAFAIARPKRAREQKQSCRVQAALRLDLGGSESRHNPTGTDMLMSAFAHCATGVHSPPPAYRYAECLCRACRRRTSVRFRVSKGVVILDALRTPAFPDGRRIVCGIPTNDKPGRCRCRLLPGTSSASRVFRKRRTTGMKKGMKESYIKT